MNHTCSVVNVKIDGLNSYLESKADFKCIKSVDSDILEGGLQLCHMEREQLRDLITNEVPIGIPQDNIWVKLVFMTLRDKKKTEQEMINEFKIYYAGVVQNAMTDVLVAINQLVSMATHVCPTPKAPGHTGGHGNDILGKQWVLYECDAFYYANQFADELRTFRNDTAHMDVQDARGKANIGITKDEAKKALQTLDKMVKHMKKPSRFTFKRSPTKQIRERKENLLSSLLSSTTTIIVDATAEIDNFRV